MVFGTQIPLVLLKTQWRNPTCRSCSRRPWPAFPTSLQQRLRQTAGANPIQSTQIHWEIQNWQQVLRGWAIWGVFAPTKPPLMHWFDEPERKKAKDIGRTTTRRGFSSETQETSVHFQSFESKRPSCSDANWSVSTTRWTLFKKK